MPASQQRGTPRTHTSYASLYALAALLCLNTTLHSACDPTPPTTPKRFVDDDEGVLDSPTLANSFHFDTFRWEPLAYLQRLWVARGKTGACRVVFYDPLLLQSLKESERDVLRTCEHQLKKPDIFFDTEPSDPEMTWVTEHQFADALDPSAYIHLTTSKGESVYLYSEISGHITLGEGGECPALQGPGGTGDVPASAVGALRDFLSLIAWASMLQSKKDYGHDDLLLLPTQLGEKQKEQFFPYAVAFALSADLWKTLTSFVLRDTPDGRDPDFSCSSPLSHLAPYELSRGGGVGAGVSPPHLRVGSAGLTSVVELDTRYPSTNWSQVTLLDLTGNRIAEISTSDVSFLERLINLEILILDNNRFEQIDFSTLPLPVRKKLRYISLRNNQLTCFPRGCPAVLNLERLDVGNDDPRIGNKISELDDGLFVERSARGVRRSRLQKVILSGSLTADCRGLSSLGKLVDTQIKRVMGALWASSAALRERYPRDADGRIPINESNYQDMLSLFIGPDRPSLKPLEIIDAVKSERPREWIPVTCVLDSESNSRFNRILTSLGITVVAQSP